MPKPKISVIEFIRENRGMATKIAKALNIERAGVYQWKQVPPTRAHVVSEITGYALHEIRPDIYPAPKKRAR